MKLASDLGFIRWLDNWGGRFDWDEGNWRKNEKHGITAAEIEGIFQCPVYVAGRIEQPGPEPRWLLLGEVGGKGWTLVVTRRAHLVRVISCRRQRTREAKFYENLKKKGQ